MNRKGIQKSIPPCLQLWFMVVSWLFRLHLEARATLPFSQKPATQPSNYRILNQRGHQIGRLREERSGLGGHKITKII